ncbi:MAG: chromosome segregation protein SMC [Candidatus Altiarchaeota archaeon]
MHLDKLELKGFKSFRDKTVIEFPDNFTAIVGPNGSGKSNLTEAICFVLGKSRGLRANNLQELIFNGGKHEKPAKTAVVSIELSDKETTHRISRMIDVDGRSIYKVDGSRASRQRVVDILGDNEYNIILQDDVTRVIKMQPQERRQIIDELCGIAEYDKKKEKALGELEKVEDRISDTEIVLGEKQGYMLRLKKERDDALAYKDIRDEIRQNEASLLNHDIIRLGKRFSTLDDRIKELENEKKQKSESIEAIRKDIEETRQKLKECNKSIIELEEDSSRARVNELNSEIVRYEERTSSLNGRGESVEARAAELVNKQGELNRELQKRQSKLAEAKKSLEKVEKLIEKRISETGQSEFEEQIDSIKNLVFGRESEIRSLDSLNERVGSELREMKKEKESAASELKAVTEKIGEVSDQLSDSTGTLSKKTEGLETLKHNIKKVDETINQLEEEFRLKQSQHTEKRTDLKVLEESGGGLRVAEKAIMKLKDVIPGIYGPLSQLGRIKSKEHEEALVIASGYRMSYIVVRDVETAKKCIEYLKKKRIGRSTFLPLDKIDVSVSGKVPDKAIGLARDFVQVDKKFDKVLDYVFGDTIIVKNIDSARAIGIGKHRMVTVEGELFEKSGAVSGGFMKKEYLMTFSNLDDLENEVKRLEDEAKSAEEKIKQERLEHESLEDTIGKTAEEISEIRIVCERLRSDLKSLSEKENKLGSDLKMISNGIIKAEKELSENSKRAASFRAEFTSKKTELQSLLEKRRPGRSQVDQLKDEQTQLAVESSRLEEQTNTIKEQAMQLLEEDKSLKNEKSSISRDLDEAKNKLAKLKEEISKLEGEGASIVDRIRTLMNRRNDLDNKITDLGSNIGGIEHEMYGLNDKISSVLVEKTKVETELEVKRQEFKKYEGSAVVDKKVTEIEGSIIKLQKKLDEFGPINMKAIETYDTIVKEFEDIQKRLETLKTERQSIFDFMEGVEKKKHKVFMDTFNTVKESFEKTFRKLSGGEGTLILDNPNNISESGLIISASPGGKKIMSLDAMSGGEKVITTSAFLLALQQYKPAYFYIVDELDAALDKANSMKLGELLRDSEAQFVLVTHNNSMIKYAGSVVGVSMAKGISKIIGVKLEEPHAS